MCATYYIDVIDPKKTVITSSTNKSMISTSKLNGDNAFVLRDFLSEVKDGAERHLKEQAEVVANTGTHLGLFAYLTFPYLILTDLSDTKRVDPSPHRP